MKERPILFKPEMVLAILRGQKTQTRRIIKPQPVSFNSQLPMPLDEAPRSLRKFTRRGFASLHVGTGMMIPRYYCEVGDRLWVRETWCHVYKGAYAMSTNADGSRVPIVHDPKSDMAAVFAAGWERSKPSRWCSPIHMPRWASRLLLEVTEVRVQRLCEISDLDAEAEGVSRDTVIDLAGALSSLPGAYRQGFRHLWDKINGKRKPWTDNPYVWAITFKVVRP